MTRCLDKISQEHNEDDFTRYILVKLKHSMVKIFVFLEIIVYVVYGVIYIRKLKCIEILVAHFCLFHCFLLTYFAFFFNLSFD